MRNFIAILIGFLMASAYLSARFETVSGLGQKTVYEEWCFNEKTTGFHEHVNECLDHGGERRVDERHFRVDFLNQRVVSDHPTLEAYRCTVFDADHWQCPLADGGAFGMIEGRYTKSLPSVVKGEGIKTYSIGVSWMTYVIISLKHILLNPFGAPLPAA